MRPFMTMLISGLLAVILPAQEPAPAAAPKPAPTLPELLEALRNTADPSWQQMVDDYSKRAKEAAERAAAARAQAQQFEEQAKAHDRSAAELQQQAERLQQMLKLLRAMPAAAPAVMPKSEAKPDAKPDAKAEPKTEPKPESKSESKSDGKLEAPAAATAVEPAAAALPTDAELVTWADVEPLLADRCSSCHEPEDKKGGLDVTSLSALRQGGGSGRSVVPGDAEQSRLYRMVAQLERPFMPKDDQPLAAADREKLRRFIDHGAAEDKAAAKRFLQQKARDAAAVAGAAPAADQPGAMPHGLPAVALRTGERPGPIRNLVRSPNAALLALPGRQQVLLLDDDLRALGVLTSTLPMVEGVAFSEDGALLLAFGGEHARRGMFERFDVATGRATPVAGALREVPIAAAVHRGRNRIASGGGDRRLRLLDLDTGAELWQGRHEDFVLAVAFDRSGRFVAAADRSGEVRVWSTDDGLLEQTFAGFGGAAQAIAFHGNGRMLLAGGADGTLRMFDVQEGRERWRQAAHRGGTTAIAVAGERIWSGGADGVVKLWQPGGRTVAAGKALGEAVYCIAPGRGNGVLAGDHQGRLHLLDEQCKLLGSVVPLQPQPAEEASRVGLPQ